ncbi:MAG: translation initiation factor IF-2 [Bariatricus sp.]
MSKLRVYELAKELNKTNKEMLSMLKEKGIEVASHMSTLSDEQIDMMKKTAAPKKTAEAQSKKEAEETDVPKKKNIVQVFRPQNTQNGGRNGRPQGQRPGARPQGNNSAQGGRPQGNNNAQGGRPQGNNSAQGGRPQGNSSAQGGRPQGNNSAQGGRPQGNNNAQGSRPQSGAQSRPFEGRREGFQGRDRDDNRRDRDDNRRDRDDRRSRDDQRQNRTGEGRREGFQGRDRDDNRRDRDDNRRGRDDQRQSRSFEGRREGFQGRDRDDRRENRDFRDKDGRDFRDKDGRDFRDKDSRDDRREGRRDDRRKSGPAIPAPAIAEQKPSRTKPKDAHKKKEYRNDDNENEERMPKGKKGKNNTPQPKLERPQPKKEAAEEQIKQITIPEKLTIQELADKMKIQPSVIVKKLFMQGKIVTINQEVDFDTAEEIAMEFEVLCEKEEVVDVIEELLKEEEEDEKKMKKRPPVVCVMGHVDHGKTSLLDAIRDTHVIEGEAGGITQHIGASVVEMNGEKITFLDTPGHEAFTAMRMRGANSTDIAILVVAADDGVMPQTVEAINHAKAAGIEIVVAINKIDKPSANIERVKQELTEYELIPEDWGGSTVFVPVSARTGEGIDNLMEMILLTAEMMELKANPNRRARGLVIEAELDKGKGPVATVLVQKGTLRVGDPVAAGSAYGKVRAMMDDKGRRVKEAGPSTPVEILGLNDVPNAGEVFVGCGNEKEARSFAETFISQGRMKMLDETKTKMSLDDLFNQIQEGNLKELGIVVKADVQGSVEAIKQSLVKLSNDEVVVKIIHGGVGAINESDVTLAAASNAIIIGFNVRPDVSAKETAEREGVDMRLYRVIYNAIEDVEAAMKGMLEPVFEEKVLGHAEVRQTFKASGVGTIAGSYVLDGVFERDCQVRITRDGIVIYDGKLASLKRFKDDVKEVKAGYECGFVFERFNDIKEGDQVEAFKMVEIPR